TRRLLAAGTVLALATGMVVAAMQAGEPVCTDTECTVTVTLPRPSPIVFPSPYPVPGPTVTVTETVTVAPDGRQLVWSDEFDGDTLDSRIWGARREGRDGNQFASCDVPETARVAAGHLLLIARRETATCAGGTRQWTTGAVYSDGRMLLPPEGALEIRALIPVSSPQHVGIWVAAWTRASSGWGEMDLFESGGGAARWDRIIHAVHHDYNATGYGNRWVERISGPHAPGWHVYRLERGKGSARWYVDGQQVWQVDPGTTRWLAKAVGGVPHWLRLSFQPPGPSLSRWYGDPAANPQLDEAGESVVARVDYVRVWSS